MKGRSEGVGLRRGANISNCEPTDTKRTSAMKPTLTFSGRHGLDAPVPVLHRPCRLLLAHVSIGYMVVVDDDARVSRSLRDDRRIEDDDSCGCSRCTCSRRHGRVRDQSVSSSAAATNSRTSNAAGLTDAALVLRHSIHKMHETSKYDYKMYAIVHPQAERCRQPLNDAGFEVLVRNQRISSPRHERRRVASPSPPNESVSAARRS